MAETTTEVIPVPSGPGRLTVTTKVVDKVAVHAAGQVPGVVRGGGGLPATPTFPAASSEVAGDRARIRVQVALAWPTAAASAAAQVQDAVAAAVDTFAGVTADRVDVEVRAYRDAPPSGRRVR